MSNTDGFPTLCQEVMVPVDVCRIRFSVERTTSGAHVGYTTRGEMVVLHFNDEGRIADIELVGDGKPCQAPIVMH